MGKKYEYIIIIIICVSCWLELRDDNTLQSEWQAGIPYM